MFRNMLRQRRRIATAFLFAQMACLVVWPSAYGAALTAMATVFASAIVIMLAPSRREWIECGAIGAFVAVWLPPFIIVPALIVVPFLVHGLLYSRLLDHAPFQLTLECQRKSQTARPITDAWSAIVPGVAHPDDHWTGELVDYDCDNDDPDTIYLRFRGTDGLFDDMTITFVDKVAPHHARYLRETSDDDSAVGALVTLDLTQMTDSRTEIRSHLKLSELPPRKALGHWFDDTYGDELDHFAETLSAKQRWRVSTRHSLADPITTA